MTHPPEAALAAGRRLGRYELVRPLGEGGMGVVWEALLHGPDGFRRPVALKLLKPGKDPVAARLALTREARLGALLSHPNVVATHEVGDADGHWFLSMELVRGPTVGDLGRAGPIPHGVLVEIGVQVCAGLAHVHGLRIDGAPAGLVHRDLKPRNLLIDRSGLVKIADLGVARHGAGPEQAAGTAGYAPPEQLEGQEDARADLFALGVVLYLMALDEMPFGRGRIALQQVLRADEVLARNGARARLDARVPGLGAVVGRLLRVAPEERFGSAAELGQALRGLRAGLEDGPSLLDLLASLHPDEVHPAEGVSGSGGALASTTATVRLAAGNLPRPADRTVGRGAEVARLAERIREGGLVTVLGLGGMGKTRLSLEAGRRVAPELGGGAWFVDLSAATDAAAVVSAVAAALGVPPGRDADPVGQVGHALRARGRALLILDNLEQVVEAAAEPIGRWRALAPETAIVVTSRIPTRVQGERILPLGPLGPEDAARLFVERAARPPSEDEAPRVTALVTALEGIPLAIELAAARTRALPLGALIDRLDQRLKWLAGGGRERPERHRSLRASLDGSFELLTPAQRAAMAQLSVFADGFALEAAEAVIDLPDPDAPWALDLVEALVDHSLLRYDRDAGRFRMLQVVRDHADEHLRPEEREAARRRHAAWFAQLGGDEAIAAHHGPGGIAALRRTVAERENLLAAARHALSLGATDLAVPLLRATWAVLELQGPPAEAERLARGLLVRELSPAARARVALVLAWSLDHQGKLPEAGAAFAEVAEAARAAGSPADLGKGLAGLAMIARQRGDVQGAEAAYREAIDAFRRAGALDTAARVSSNYGMFLAHRGQIDEARQRIDAALAAARRSGDPRFLALAHHHLANFARLVGDAVGHRDHTAAAHALAIELGDRRTEGQLLANLALAEAMVGHHDEAMRLYELARPIHAEVGDRKAEAVLLTNLALEFERLTRFEDAHDCYRQCLALYRDIGAVDGIGQALGNLAILLRRKGEPAEAEEAIREAIAIHRRLGNRRSEAITTGTLGLIVADHGDLDEAARLQQEALRLHREVHNRRSEGITLGNLGFVHQRAGRREEAEACYRAALAIHQETGNRGSEGQMWTNLGTLAIDRGDRAEARRCLREAVVLHKETTHPDKRLHAAGMLAELAVADGDLEEASRWLEDAEETTTTFAELSLPPELAALRDRLRKGG